MEDAATKIQLPVINSEISVGRNSLNSKPVKKSKLIPYLAMLAVLLNLLPRFFDLSLLSFTGWYPEVFSDSELDEASFLHVLSWAEFTIGSMLFFAIAALAIGFAVLRVLYLSATSSNAAFVVPPKLIFAIAVATSIPGYVIFLMLSGGSEAFSGTRAAGLSYEFILSFIAVMQFFATPLALLIAIDPEGMKARVEDREK